MITYRLPQTIQCHPGSLQQYHVIQVAYDNADVAVTTLSITSPRHSVVDFTFPTIVDVSTWMSRAPGRIPPFLNLINTMDVGCWVSTLVSVVAIGLALVLAVKVLV